MDEEECACPAHLGEMCSVDDATSVWPIGVDMEALGFAKHEAQLSSAARDRIKHEPAVMQVGVDPAAGIAELDKWVNPFTGKVTYLNLRGASGYDAVLDSPRSHGVALESKDEPTTDPFIKIDRIELATKDPKRWLAEIDAKVERSAAMTRTQVAFNCLPWTRQRASVMVRNDRVYVEADASHYLECMPVDVAGITGLHLAAFPWEVRIHLGDHAHVIYRSDDGGRGRMHSNGRVS
jgi:hypothetical protein